MGEWHEIERVEDIQPHDGLPVYYVKCRRCGRQIALHFNGGEMDEVDCCGLRYRNEIGRVDLVVEEERG